jgi:SAM-dependent methyltransferase
MNATSEWWETFFRGPWGEWQARGYMQEHTATEADFIVRALGLKAGNDVLDVACGTGRHAIELAARGMNVTGIDFNNATLDVARAAAAARGEEPRFLTSDMRCLRFSEEFDAAYCFWTSFGYFEDDSHDLVAAKRIAESLRPGGRFLIDIMAMETILPVFTPSSCTEFGENGADVLREDRRLDLETGRIEATWTFVEQGQTRSASSSLRLYSYHELCELLREAGFRSFSGYDSSTGEAFALGARRLGLVASL